MVCMRFFTYKTTAKIILKKLIQNAFYKVQTFLKHHENSEKLAFRLNKSLFISLIHRKLLLRKQKEYFDSLVSAFIVPSRGLFIKKMFLFDFV